LLPSLGVVSGSRLRSRLRSEQISAHGAEGGGNVVELATAVNCQGVGVRSAGRREGSIDARGDLGQANRLRITEPHEIVKSYQGDPALPRCVCPVSCQESELLSICHLAMPGRKPCTSQIKLWLVESYSGSHGRLGLSKS